ncbi:MAG: hypothetical protein ABJB47_17040, partial [Actinomycetota bacterium]
FAMALTSTGQVYAWGQDNHGQLGDGRLRQAVSPVPVLVRLPHNARVTAVSAGGAHALALTSGGQVLAWGSDSDGQLGDGPLGQGQDQRIPGPVLLRARVTAISAGGRHSLALTAADEVLAWGDNSQGQLGDGTTTDRSRPAPVQLSLVIGQAVAEISAGSVHSMLLTSDQQVLNWGGNSRQQLGINQTINQTLPVSPIVPQLGPNNGPIPGFTIGAGPASTNSFMIASSALLKVP